MRNNLLTILIAVLISGGLYVYHPLAQQSLGAELGQATFTTATNASSSVSGTSSTVVATNTARLLLSVSNTGTSTVYLNFRTTAVAQTGIALFASSTYRMDGVENAIYTGPVSAITATGAGASVISIMEK